MKANQTDRSCNNKNKRARTQRVPPAAPRGAVHETTPSRANGWRRLGKGSWRESSRFSGDPALTTAEIKSMLVWTCGVKESSVNCLVGGTNLTNLGAGIFARLADCAEGSNPHSDGARRVFHKVSRALLLWGLIGLIGLVCGCEKAGEAGAKIARARWEYQTVEIVNKESGSRVPAEGDWLPKYSKALRRPGWIDYSEAKLRDLGDEGWELVSTVPELETIPNANIDPEETSGARFNNIRVRAVTLIFKRQR